MFQTRFLPLIVIIILMIEVPPMGEHHSDFTATSDRAEYRPVGHRPRAFTFVQLVFESKYIVVGTVITTTRGMLPIRLSVERSFPAGLSREIRVSGPEPPGLEQPQFSVSEPVILFLETVQDSEGMILGTGDVGKWPRQGANWIFTVGHVQPLREVISIIELLFSVQARKTFEERVQLLLTNVILAGSLGSIAAAQYTADYGRWEGVQSVGEGGLPTVRWLVAATFLGRGKPEDPAVDYAVLQLLTTAPTSIAIPYLIKRLDDPDAAVRDTAFSSLRTVTLPYTQETFTYVSNAPPDQRKSSIQKWRRWWDQHQSARLKDEVPRMLSELDAPHVLRRSAADWSLRLLSNRNVGYDATAPVEQRREATARWQEWWKQFSPQLK
jgi:hypothetical protein